ncbi:MAG: redoxin domain-containing protein [Dehalococcoidia bacterium]|nr:redoxin domain-containing protein [Dehalococcoidia bacterium]
MSERASGAVREEPIAVGERAPDFVLPAIASDGEQTTVSLAQAAAEGPVLLLFYQDDGMPVCTSELKAFAQEHPLLAEAGVRVFGVNTNGLGSHTRFQERDRFPFPLISDFYGDAVKAYGLWDADEAKSRRAAVIVGQDGLVRHVVPHFNPGNVNALVEVFQALGLA